MPYKAAAFPVGYPTMSNSEKTISTAETRRKWETPTITESKPIRRVRAGLNVAGFEATNYRVS